MLNISEDVPKKTFVRALSTHVTKQGVASAGEVPLGFGNLLSLHPVYQIQLGLPQQKLPKW